MVHAEINIDRFREDYRNALDFLQKAKNFEKEGKESERET